MFSGTAGQYWPPRFRSDRFTLGWARDRSDPRPEPLHASRRVIPDMGTEDGSEPSDDEDDGDRSTLDRLVDVALEVLDLF